MWARIALAANPAFGIVTGLDLRRIKVLMPGNKLQIGENSL
jgi:hypothetical protein